MEIRGWPKVLGLIIASAFGGALAFAACLVIFFSYFSMHGASMEIQEREPHTTVHGAPPITERKRFLGTMGSYNSEFDPRNNDKVLERGPGEIVGSVTSSGRPVKGVRIRLALNGIVMSQTAETGSDGKYHIPVPYGTYRVDGFTYETERLDDFLGGKTDSPKNRSAFMESLPLVVAEGKPATVPGLDYIDPVQVTGPSGEVSIRKPIVISWNAYPGAATYRVQLNESKGSGAFESTHSVFRWNDRPEALGTSVELGASQVAQLHAGSYYQVDVEALDPSMGVIATSGNRYTSKDFRVVE